MEIRNYRKEDEVGWVRCRTLSFLDTAFYDNVLKEKETYENPAIELVAVIENNIVGLLDIEYETQEGTVCTRGSGLGGMIWHIAVHLDFRRRGIGKKLLFKAQEKSKAVGLNYLEAWTRDDEWVNRWYDINGFDQEESYLQVFIEGAELSGVIKSDISKLYPVLTFAHYVGEEQNEIKKKFKRTHECFCYKKRLI